MYQYSTVCVFCASYFLHPFHVVQLLIHAKKAPGSNRLSYNTTHIATHTQIIIKLVSNERDVHHQTNTHIATSHIFCSTMICVMVFTWKFIYQMYRLIVNIAK